MIVFAFFCLLNAIWSSVYAFVSSANTSEVAWLLINRFSFCQVISASSFLHFALLFTGIVQLRQWALQLLLYVPGIIFTVKGAFGPLIFDKLVYSGGAWVQVTAHSPFWTQAYAICFHVFFTAGIIAIAWKYWRTREAAIIIAGYTLSAVLVIFANVVQPGTGIESPRITHLFSLIWVVSIWYWINKHAGGEDRQERPNTLWELFSNREHEIIGLIAKGYSYREIGERLYISYHTVKSHVERIYTKAEAKNKAQLLYKLSNKSE